MEERKRRGREGGGKRKEGGGRGKRRERGTYLELFPQFQVDHLLGCPLVVPGAHQVDEAGCPDRDRGHMT